MNALEVFPSKFLKASDIGTAQPVVEIMAVVIETLGQGEDQETKPVCYFKAKEKGLVCNKTNFNTLIDLFGPETDDWIGKKIKIMSMEVAFRGKMTMSLRISPMNMNTQAAASVKSAKSQQPSAATAGTPTPENDPEHDDAGAAF
jgi:hypothetical protein